jgi:hypothetical protein
MNEVLAPFIGLTTSRDGHGAHLRRDLKLSADGAWGHIDPFRPYPLPSNAPDREKQDRFSVQYFPVVMCDGDVDGKKFAPTLDWALSIKTRRFIEQAAVRNAPGSCKDVPGVEQPADAIAAVAKVIRDSESKKAAAAPQ